MKIIFEKKYKPPMAKVKSFTEYSKKVITALVLVWFIGFILGCGVVVLQAVRGDITVNLSDLLLYVGAPMTGGIVSYMLKSAFENREKIKKENSYNEEFEN